MLVAFLVMARGRCPPPALFPSRVRITQPSPHATAHLLPTVLRSIWREIATASPRETKAPPVRPLCLPTRRRPPTEPAPLVSRRWPQHPPHRRASWRSPTRPRARTPPSSVRGVPSHARVPPPDWPQAFLSSWRERWRPLGSPQALPRSRRTTWWPPGWPHAILPSSRTIEVPPARPQGFPFRERRSKRPRGWPQFHPPRRQTRWRPPGRSQAFPPRRRMGSAPPWWLSD